MYVEGGIQLGDLWGIVRRRAQIAVFAALAVFLASYWIAMALPNVYSSYATVLVEPQSVDEQLVRAGVQASDLNERLHLMTAQILSRPRLSRIIEQHDLYREESDYLLRENIIDLMRSRIKVDPVVPDLERGVARRGSLAINEFRITFSDYSAKLARDVAQPLATDCIATHIDARVQVSQKSLEFIQGELERLAARIRAAEAEVAKVKNEHAGSLPEDFETNQRQMERVLGHLSAAHRALSEAASDQEFFSSQARAADAFATNDDASPARKLELLKLQLAEFTSRGFTDKHPDIISTRAEVAAVEASIDEIAERGDESGRPSLIRQQSQAQANHAALRRAAAEAEIVRLEATADEIQALIGGTPAVAELLDGLKRDYEHLFASFQDFSNRHQEATVQAQLERRQLGEQFRVLESAFEAPDPSAPNRLLIMVLGAFAGVGLGLGLAILMEAADSSVHDARRLQNRLQLPVLASIPQIWLEADRVSLRRSRLRTLAATMAVVVVALAGGAANYMWVNGAPGFLESALSDDDGTEPVAAAGTGG